MLNSMNNKGSNGSLGNLGSMSNKGLLGQIHPGRATSRVAGGYIVESRGLPQGKGFVPDTIEITMNKDLLVKVVGQHQGMPLLHPVFAGFR
ncbi:MAG: hypothetical protein K2X77_01140 [Candidatus Obscuribacterales bacterium]|jgi:hypothetical protein|nr:hypothetical protein [Candidatus Obscuribacterales bacterium]